MSYRKSQIAMEYAYEVHDLSPGKSVFWVHGSTKAAFEESYRSLADHLDLPNRHDPKTDILSLVCSWLQRIEPWLMILDNADDIDTFFGDAVARPIASYLPKTNGKILVTSRNLNVAERLTGSYKAIMRIPTMSSAESLRLLQTKLVSAFEEDAAMKLVELLDCVPLAVNQAAAYINRRQISISSYIERFEASEKRKTALLNHDGGDIRRHEGVSNSVVVAWQLTFEQILQESAGAANLLSLMSLFHAKNIPHYLLLGYSEENMESTDGDTAVDTSEATVVDKDEMSSDDESKWSEDDDLEDDLDILLSYCLVSTSATAEYCEMHSLVQFCTQRWLLRLGSLARWKSLFLALTSTYFPDGSFATWADCQMFLPHIEGVLEEQPRQEADILNWSLLLTNVSCYMSAIGKFDKAENLSRKASEARKKLLGTDHAATMTSLGNLAVAFADQGRLDEAEMLQLQILETRRANLGEDHNDTLLIMANLAVTYTDQGRWNEAAELEVDVLEARKLKLGVRHPDTLLSMSNLASTYSRQGRWVEAEKLQKQVLDAYEAELGGDHPDTLAASSSLALTYRNQGQLERAGALQAKVLETRKVQLGDDHPATLKSMANLAVTYSDNGSLAEAEKLALHVTDARKRLLGEDHPDTLGIMAILAAIYCDQLEFVKAEKLGVDVMEAYKAKLGSDHPNTLLSMHNLASMYWDLDQLDKAEELELQVFETRKAKLGAEHPHTLASMHNLAFTVKSQSPDRLEEALDLMRDCVALGRRVLGADHPSTVASIDIMESWEKLQEKPAEGQMEEPSP